MLFHYVFVKYKVLGKDELEEKETQYWEQNKKEIEKSFPEAVPTYSINADALGTNTLEKYICYLDFFTRGCRPPIPPLIKDLRPEKPWENTKCDEVMEKMKSSSLMFSWTHLRWAVQNLAEIMQKNDSIHNI